MDGIRALEDLVGKREIRLEQALERGSVLCENRELGSGGWGHKEQTGRVRVLWSVLCTNREGGRE